MRHFPDSVLLAGEPQALLERLVDTCDEFQHIKEAAPRIPVLFSQRALYLHGGQKAAVIVQPRWQGPLANTSAFLYAMLVAPVFDGEDPDYLVVVDIAIWTALSAEGRERLLFHELKHLAVMEDEFGVPRRSRETGQPLLKLVPHDVEVFHAEIVRYGPEVVGLEETLQAIIEGQALANRRKLKIA